MMSHTLIVGEQPEDLTDALRVLDGCNVALQTRDVVQRAQAAHRDEGRLALYLTERDTMADLRSLLERTSAVVLLIAPTSPPRASLARIARLYGAGLCSREDPRPVREAMLIALGRSGTERDVS